MTGVQTCALPISTGIRCIENDTALLAVSDEQFRCDRRHRDLFHNRYYIEAVISSAIALVLVLLLLIIAYIQVLLYDAIGFRLHQSSNNARQPILNSLKPLDVGQRCAIQNRVCIIQSTADERTGDGFCSVVVDRWTAVAEGPNVKETCLAEIWKDVCRG